PDSFSISIAEVAGNETSCGDSDTKFTAQSISKVVAYCFVLERLGQERVDEKVGVDWTGEEYDSIIRLDHNRKPFNPMVNAGAITVADLILSHYGKDALKQLQTYMANFIGSEPALDAR